MKAITLLRYFFYVAVNWNLQIALHIIINEIRGEKKYGINSTGADELKNMTLQGIDTSHATIYMPASYDILETIFPALQKHKTTHIVDFGCGKGRVLRVAADYGFTKLTGVDFSRAFCEAARANLNATALRKTDVQINIIHNDAFYLEIPADADCFFFFNPFDETIMSGVVLNIIESLSKNPRFVQVVYLNPQYKSLFTDAGFNETFHVKKMNYLEGCILAKS